MIEIITWHFQELLYFLVFLLDIVIVGVGIIKLTGVHHKWFDRMFEWISSNALLLAFIFALSSMVGSLFFSEIKGYAPCPLCWYQRIFMYPLVFLFGYDLYTGKKDSWTYGVVLSVVGGAIALYHTVLHQLARFGVEGGSCGSANVPCEAMYGLHYGYITIPVMALTGFLGILLVWWLQNER